MKKQKVSIIIAVWNGANTLDKCLQSIQAQTYSEIELIVMDGGSTDGTQSILESYSDLITFWESKKDKGIYNAWNKALSHVSGDWVCFLGSDDCWAYPEAIHDMLNGVTEQVQLVSGKVAFLRSTGEIKGEYGHPWEWSKIKKSHCIGHPGALFHRKCFEQYGLFDESYRIAADYDFSLRLGSELKAVYINRVLVLMGDSGVSRSQIIPVLKESWRAQSLHKEIGKTLATYHVLRTYLVIQIKRLFGLF